MRAVDRWAIEEQGVPSLELMEAAGAAVAQAVDGLAPDGPVRVVCGKGNNGGDGLVAARLLAEWGFEVEVVLLWPAGELSDDAAVNLKRFRGTVIEVDPADPAAGAGRLRGAVVDAIFGTGFEGAPREPAAAAIEAINACGAPVVAADIASGVDASSGEVEGVAVEADGHRRLPRRQARPLDRARQVAHRGELRVAPIGIPDGRAGRARGRPDRRWRARAGAPRAARARPSSARAQVGSSAARAA